MRDEVSQEIIVYRDTHAIYDGINIIPDLLLTLLELLHRKHEFCKFCRRICTADICCVCKVALPRSLLEAAGRCCKAVGSRKHEGRSFAPETQLPSI